MASQSLYRKWRSQSFADLVGQEPVVRTLCNAVRDGHLSHAYLFCGPRGTGKTSVARLLAKAVNCANPRDGEPCNQCLSCREIAQGRSPDVIEIDAASNNSVENIRELRGNVNVMSTGGRYKVYVIDEVHMLSPAAFNALLKTLEEPPPHIIFVLATTEAHKVLPTIVSRCQRFDFRRITQRDIVARLEHVARGEGLRLDPIAADLLARAAQGGLRDALSLLDQAMAFCGSDISLDGVRGMLGLADAGAVRTLVAQVAAGQAAEGLHLINELVEGGADLRQINGQLAELWRALVLAGAGADVARIMDCGPEEAKELAELASRFSLDELAACARVFGAGDTPTRGLPVPQLGLELAFLECVGIRRRSEAMPARAPTRAQPLVMPAPAPHAPTRVPAPASAEPPRPTAPMPHPEALPVDDGEVEELDLSELDLAMPTPSPVGNVGAIRDVLPAEGGAVAAGLAPAWDGALDDGGDPGEQAPEAAAGDEGDWLRRLRDQWELVKKVCKQRKRTVAALLHSARPIMVADGTSLEVVLQADYQFHLDKLREPNSRQDVEWALEQVLERPCHVRLVLAGSGGPDAPGSAHGPSGLGGAPGRGDPTAPQPRPSGGAGPSRGPAARGMHGENDRAAASSGGNGATAVGVRDAGVRDAAARYTGARAITSLPTVPAPIPADVAPVDMNDGSLLRALEDEARADPVIQEIIRTFPAQLVEVRPISSGEQK